jgi:hypothetical protein
MQCIPPAEEEQQTKLLMQSPSYNGTKDIDAASFQQLM